MLTENYVLTAKDFVNIENHELLLRTGIFKISSTNSILDPERQYSFTSQSVMEYACALIVAELVKSTETSQMKELKNLLMHPKLNSVCRFVTGILGNEADRLLTEIIKGDLDTSTLILICNCIHECGEEYEIVRKMASCLPPTIDFSWRSISSCTIDGR